MTGIAATWTSPLLELLYEDPRVGHCLVAPDGSVLRVNEAWLRCTGFDLDEVLGQDYVALFPDRRELLLALHGRARTGHPVEAPRQARRTGARESSWDEVVAPLPMQGGTGLLVRTYETAERMSPREEAALRESERWFRALSDAMPQIVCVLAPEGMPEYVNTSWAAYSGLDLAGTVRAGWEGVVHPDDVAAARQCRRRALELRAAQDVELRYRAADGGYRWFLSRLAPILDDRGRLVRFIGAGMDIDDRKRAGAERERLLAELQDVDRRKDDFLSMLSHELRNPLAPIRNSVYVLERADPAGAQAVSARAVIQRQIEHLTRLVEDLLDVTRVGRGKIQLRRQRLDLCDVVRRACEDYRPLLEQRQVCFAVSLPRERAWVEADATRLTQVIGNLLQNAAKFTRRGDEVEVALRLAGDGAEIRVRDTGAGLDPALLPHLFEPFFQGERTLARTEGGLGLGLALVKGIAELHGGSARAESGGLGKGAEFVVRLPLAVQAEAQDPAPTRATRARRGRRVLVVDDNRDGAESLAAVVRLFGHEPEVAFDGPAALELARARPFDVVLCDIGLPGMSGFEVARALRARASGPLLLVAVSGYAQPEDRRAAAEAGFDRHIAKPASPEEIERILEGAAGGPGAA